MAAPQAASPEVRAHHSIYRRSWHLRVNVIAGSFLLRPAARASIYRRAGMRIETDKVQPGCFFFGNDIAIGADTWVNHRCYFDTRARIEIGRRCDLGMEVMLCTSAHEPGTRERRAGGFVARPIVVGDGVWLGTRAMLLPGVSVGDGCVVAAGAVVAEDCEANGLYAGVPARRIRDLD